MNRRKRKTQRGSRQIANPVRLLRLFRSPVRSALAKALITHDRRLFHMDPLNRPLSERRKDARKVIRGEMRSMPRRSRPKYLRDTLPARLFFDKPHRIDLCIRRKVRREVLLALGRGGGNHRRPRRNEWSDVSCGKR